MNAEYLNQYLFVGLFALFALVFGMLPLIAARFVTPRKPSKSKQDTYECGLEAVGEPWIQFRAQFYVIALIFIIFDVETIFIFPWAVAFQKLRAEKLDVEAFWAMMIFVGILVLGLLYEWRKKSLEWE
ncbi:MAG: NADH-quinone oxidoreductase subunit A [Planctomycetes bacterium]|nr:NADH-quinone oxidoreductase subunit A [Planctomycetota bacterium]